ncbi:hypothetical protein M0M57_11850 [Flavobacterium azooxidireducens]|uniref:HTH cro/C1-type domain-containing protein n=1 Tax=Flavobacterium azooxidireducens TaxID=1871076 RepID=A0ABY4KC00_9FLAO|nr:hypothetical protein [Flavobacterium azooxidireducens]UPQ78312.1 hypothetical protein M0M57_11850 [Flavobacterium azooxidireducens]
MKTAKEIEIVIAEIDFNIIEKIREIRLKREPIISQMALSQMLGLADGFVGKVENIKESSKYNLWHLNKIIKVLNLKFTDVLPSGSYNFDIVKIHIKLKETRNKNEKSYEVLSMKPLTEKEMQLFKQNKIPYLKIIK